jgi:hypothetical protein
MAYYFSEESIFSPKQIVIKKDNILKALDVPLNEKDPYVEELIPEFIQKSIEICSPKAIYGLFENPVFGNKFEMDLNGRTFALDKIVLSALKESSHIAIFVATAGDLVEKLSKQLLKEGHLLEGLIVDLIGSEIAEETTELIHKQIGHEMYQKGLYTTNRYSPGYCNWPVSDQQKLFSLLDSNTCGIKLTQSSLMLPIKSISGIVGVGINVKKRNYSCSICEVGACIYRDKR